MTETKIYGMPECECPTCKRRIDAAGTEDEQSVGPTPGDLTICFHCLAVMVFNDDLTLRLIEKEEYNGLPDESKREIELQQHICRSFQARLN